MNKPSVNEVKEPCLSHWNQIESEEIIDSPAGGR